MDQVFTIGQIKDAWTEYQEKKAWRVLRDGKWKLYLKNPDTTDGTTRAEMVKLKDHMSFPKYLEVFNQ